MTAQFKSLSANKNQHGMALITVLFVFAIAAVLAVSIATASYYSMKKTSNHLDRVDLHAYLSGGEALAKVLLFDDWSADKEENAEIDFNDEDWGKQEHKFSFEEGELLLRIQDLQSRFNLSGLVKDGKRDDLQYQRFGKLLRELDIPLGMADKLIDWIDSNQSTTNNGAEDIVYLGLEKPYRTGDTTALSVSELYLLQDVERADIDKLIPWVVVLEDAPGINVNTASAEVLASLSDTITMSIAQQLQETLKATPVESVEDFLQLSEVSGLGIKEDGLSVKSQHFEAEIKAVYQKKVKKESVHFERNSSDGAVRVVSRNYGIPFKSQEEE